MTRENRPLRRRPWFLAAVVLTAAAAAQSPALPQQEGDLGSFLPEGEGKSLVLKHCTLCHSALRIQQVFEQASTAEFWKRTVQRMIASFNAPIPEDEAALLTEYLNRNFGSGDSAKMEAHASHRPTAFDPLEELNAFFPEDRGKALVTLYCTACHSSKTLRKSIAQRAGHERDYWRILVRRMITAWNAPIPDEDVGVMADYLARHFGPQWRQRIEP